jgi:hypothetical protein
MRLAVGSGLLVWGVAGLYLTDPIAQKMGLQPSDKDKEELDRWTPHITTVDKNKGRS